MGIEPTNPRATVLYHVFTLRTTLGRFRQSTAVYQFRHSAILQRLLINIWCLPINKKVPSWTLVCQSLWVSVSVHSTVRTNTLNLISDSRRIRTPNPGIRIAVLYPVELYCHITGEWYNPHTTADSPDHCRPGCYGHLLEYAHPSFSLSIKRGGGTFSVMVLPSLSNTYSKALCFFIGWILLLKCHGADVT